MKLRSGALAAAAATVAVLALAGCNNSGDAGSAGGDALTQYRDCLSRNGVTLPSFGPRASAFPTVRPTDRPTTRPTDRPTTRPTDRPTARPTVRPSGVPDGVRPSGFPGGGDGRFPQGVDASAFAKAQQECASLRPSGQPGFGDFGGDRRQGGDGDGRSAAYRNCLTENGVTLQDGQQPDASDPKVAAALKTCEVLKPSASPSN